MLKSTAILRKGFALTINEVISSNVSLIHHAFNRHEEVDDKQLMLPSMLMMTCLDLL